MSPTVTAGRWSEWRTWRAPLAGALLAAAGTSAVLWWWATRHGLALLAERSHL